MNYKKTLDFIVDKTKKTMRADYFPHITQNGKWQTTEDGYWTGGFWIGQLWWMYLYTGKDIFKKEAIKWLKKLENRKTSHTFDLGFMFWPSYILGYKITQIKELRNTALEAADTQLFTFNQHLKMIYDEMVLEKENKTIGKIIIDIMPNLKLLWWAHEETGNREYYNTADIHSQRTREELIREDGSSFQGMIFDLKTNEILRKVTFQGINTESCWSRGQAWGILGYAMAYQATGRKEYFYVAKKLITCFINNLPGDKVPYWDFNADENPTTIRDTSAATIACSGLLTLYRNTKDKYYKNKAEEIIVSLIENYLAGINREGILTDGCFYIQKDWGVNESLIWGDYFFVESLMQLIDKKNLNLEEYF